MITTEQLYHLYLQHPVISTDTRKIAPGSMFFALKGNNFDANTFAKKAIEAGAAYAVIDNPQYQINNQYLLVNDALTALQKLAAHHRGQLTIPVIGLTGTNGKTTTKELINAVLSQRFSVLATGGNLNNHIGVPLTILSITAKHQVAVIEMGANHQQEIATLCSIAQPTHGLITNVGKAHLEGFGGVEGVKKGKGELYDYIATQPAVGEQKKMAFINSNDNTLLRMQQDRSLTNVIYYGKNSDVKNMISGKLLVNDPFLTLSWTGKNNIMQEVSSRLTGAYNLDNILAAICIGNYFNLTAAEINYGIAGYEPTNNRSQMMKTATNTLICDFYNANPSSMLVAIENMSKLQASHKVLILGDMFEMGTEAAVEHANIVQTAMDIQADERIFIGKEFFNVSQATAIPSTEKNLFYTNTEEAIDALKDSPIKNATILIKGSRGMALEKLVAQL